MATALASQLAKIAKQGRNPLDLKEHRKAHSQSLIFDASVAAIQDFDTLYEICVEGYQELCRQDARLSAFSRSLFGENCKTIERTGLTQDQNDDLDTIIERFLILLGPKLSLRPSTLALEWLIRRFRIHEYNTTCLMLTVLPYHTRDNFVRLLSILPKPLSPTLVFLRPYVEKQESLPRHAVVHAATHNHAFFSSWSKYTLDSCRQGSCSPIAVTYWATVAIEVVTAQLDTAIVGRREAQSEREGNVLRRILPVLSEGLTMQDAAEMRSGCFAIVSILTSRVQMEGAAVAALMEAVVEGCKGKLTSTELTCLALVVQSTEILKLPKTVLKAVTAKQDAEELTAALHKIGAQTPAGSLCVALLKAYASRAKGKKRQTSLDDYFRLLKASIEKDLLTAAQLASALAMVVSGSITSSEADQQMLSTLRASLIWPDQSKVARQTVGAALRISGISVVQGLDESQEAQDEPKALGEGQTERMEKPSQVEWDALASQVPSSSFLATFATPLFDVLLQHLTFNPEKPLRLDEFVGLGVFSNQSGSVQLPFVTFLLRILDSKTSSIQKMTALRSLRVLLQRQEQNTDVQVILPYIIFCLGDASPAVRQAASDLTLTAMKLYSNLQKEAENGNQISHLGQGVAYGAEFEGEKDSESQWLSLASIMVFLSRVLVDGLEECRQDPDHIGRSISQALTKAKPTKDKSRGDLDKTHRSVIFNWLCQSAILTKSYMLAFRLLKIVNQVEESKAILKVARLSQMVQSVSRIDDAELEQRCETDGVDAKHFRAEVLKVITNRKEASDAGLAILQALISSNSAPDSTAFRLDALERLKTLWPGMRHDVRPSFAVQLFRIGNTVSQSEDSAFQAAACATLRGMELFAVELGALLEDLPGLISKALANEPAAKKRKRNNGRTELADGDRSEESAWMKTTFCLELVEGSDVKSHSILLPKLFTLLDDMQQFEHHGGQVNAYTQSLLLDCLASSVVHMDTRAAEKISTIQTDLVVDCFRTASGPQVRHSALKLLSVMSKVAPEVIIHSVMPIFTLMGSNVLAMSDDNSIQIVEQTMGSVIPPLLANFRRQKGGPLPGVAELLSGFVAALDHMPGQQRLGVFSTLIDVLRADEFLHALFVLVVDRYDNDRPAINLLVQLASKQNGVALMQTVLKCLNTVEKLTGPAVAHDGLIDALSGKTSKSVVATGTFALLATVLRNARVRKNTAQALAQDSSAGAVQDIHTAILEQSTRLTDRFSSPSDSEEYISGFSESLADCLPIEESMRAIGPLLKRPDDDIRLGALRALLYRIKSTTTGGANVQAAGLTCLKDILCLLPEATVLEELLTIILCINKVAERCGNTNRLDFSTTPESLSDQRLFSIETPQLSTATLICQATLVDVLREDYIPHAPEIQERALRLLQEVSESSEPAVAELENACYFFFHALLLNIPWAFMGEKLARLVTLAEMSPIRDVKTRIPPQKAAVLGLVATEIDATACITTLSHTLGDAVRHSAQTTKKHLELVQLAVERRPKSVIIDNASTLMGACLEALDTRRLHRGTETQMHQYDDDELTELETAASTVLMKMIYKLNDKHFRPLFARAWEWLEARDLDRSPSSKLLRATAWYGFLAEFFGSLKSIVTNYSAFLVDSAAELLRVASYTDSDGALLLARVLATLHASCTHDQDGFWHAHDRFETLFEPLLSHLSPAAMHPKSDLPELLLECIVAFAVAAGSPEHHRALNAAVLPRLRDEDARVRRAAARCEVELTKRMGEEWLAMLPEMLPFIAEALEDDDERVEAEVRVWVRDVEAQTGESLDAMLH